MSEKKFVFSIAIGDDYRRISEITWPTIKRYADRIGADSMNLIKDESSFSSPHWEKFLINDILCAFDRVIYLDSDLIIRPDCPDLFRLTSPAHIGAFNEGRYADRPEMLIRHMADRYGYPMPAWDGRYFNTGVMVVSKSHKHLFEKPTIEHGDSYLEQSYINLMIALHKVPVHDIGYRFNRMGCVDESYRPSRDRLDSYILHYAGWHTQGGADKLIPRIEADLDAWQKNVI